MLVRSLGKCPPCSHGSAKPLPSLIQSRNEVRRDRGLHDDTACIIVHHRHPPAHWLVPLMASDDCGPHRVQGGTPCRPWVSHSVQGSSGTDSCLNACCLHCLLLSDAPPPFISTRVCLHAPIHTSRAPSSHPNHTSSHRHTCSQCVCRCIQEHGCWLEKTASAGRNLRKSGDYKSSVSEAPTQAQQRRCKKSKSDTTVVSHMEKKGCVATFCAERPTTREWAMHTTPTSSRPPTQLTCTQKRGRAHPHDRTPSIVLLVQSTAARTNDVCTVHEVSTRAAFWVKRCFFITTETSRAWHLQ